MFCSDCFVEEFVEDPRMVGDVETFDLPLSCGDEDIIVEDVADGAVFGSYCCQGWGTWILRVVPFLFGV